MRVRDVVVGHLRTGFIMLGGGMVLLFLQLIFQNELLPAIEANWSSGFVTATYVIMGGLAWVGVVLMVGGMVFFTVGAYQAVRSNQPPND